MKSKSTSQNRIERVMPRCAESVDVTTDTTLPEPLFYTRRQTAHVLGYKSVASVIRLEQEGVLRAYRHRPRPTGQVFNAVAEVHALAARRQADEA
jgi:hypothetical protein